MKPEQSERILVEELFKKTIAKKILSDDVIVNVEKLTGDASTRKYYRIWTSKESYVVCLDNPSHVADEEPTFIKLQKILENEGVRVPYIYDKELSTGFILEEDLGDKTFLLEVSKVETIEKEYAFYIEAIDSMAKIHLINVGKYQNKEISKLAFDTEKLFSEMAFSKKYFLGRFLGLSLETETVKTIDEELLKICQEIDKEKRVLVHRDYHSRNIMIIDGKQVVIDFQDARMGTPLYDLVSLLEDCYYQVNARNKEKLIQYYFNNYFKKLDPSKSFESFLRLYDLMTIQRVYKAIGSFAFIYEERKDLRYIKYIGYAFEKIRSVMLTNSDLDELRVKLSGLYYAN